MQITQFFFFLNLSVTCWLAVGRLSVTCRPTGFSGSSSSQLPDFDCEVEDGELAVMKERKRRKVNCSQDDVLRTQYECLSLKRESLSLKKKKLELQVHLLHRQVYE